MHAAGRDEKPAVRRFALYGAPVALPHEVQNDTDGGSWAPHWLQKLACTGWPVVTAATGCACAAMPLRGPTLRAVRPG